MTISTYDKGGHSLLFEVNRGFILETGSNWSPTSISVLFPQVIENDLLDHTFRLGFELCGKHRFGNDNVDEYSGLKFARCSATIRLIQDPSQFSLPEAEPNAYVYNEDVINERYGLNEEIDYQYEDDDYELDED